MDASEFTDPLFKGATRPAMVFGIPLIPAMVAGGSIMLLASYTTIWFYLLMVPVGLVMRAISAQDDQQFRLLWLRFYCRVIRFNGNAKFWQASSYAPMRGKHS